MWTQQRVGCLCEWWHEGLSASVIARRFSDNGFKTTRNAVIGKINRIGAGLRPGAKPTPANWSAAESDLLLRIRATGVCIEEMVAQLGALGGRVFTPSMIYCKLRRLRLPRPPKRDRKAGRNPASRKPYTARRMSTDIAAVPAPRGELWFWEPRVYGRDGGTGGCEYIHGDPATLNWYYCNAGKVLGCYCGTHALLCGSANRPPVERKIQKRSRFGNYWLSGKLDASKCARPLS